jgi:hypothetical protein
MGVAVQKWVAGTEVRTVFSAMWTEMSVRVQ